MRGLRLQMLWQTQQKAEERLLWRQWSVLTRGTSCGTILYLSYLPQVSAGVVACDDGLSGSRRSEIGTWMESFPESLGEVVFVEDDHAFQVRTHRVEQTERESCCEGETCRLYKGRMA